MMGLEGSRLGRYELRHRIALGGMAEIYLGYDPRVRRQVAVKVLYGRDAAFIRRFEREAAAVGRLDHDHILPLYDFGEQQPWYYLVMPYIKGENLRDYLQKRKVLSLQEAASIIDQVASALQCAHDHGVVHRDVKPSNILLRPDGYAYLVDFGLAKAMMETEALTHDGAMVGTPEYMAPEQSNGASDHRSDIYALGVILYQMLTGRVPFTAESPVAISLKHIQATPTPPHEFNSEISPEVEAVILKAMAKNPAERYQEAQAFSLALWKAIKQEPFAVGAADDFSAAIPVSGMWGQDQAQNEVQAKEHISSTTTVTLRATRGAKKKPPPTPLLFSLTELAEEQTEKMPSQAPPGPAFRATPSAPSKRIQTRSLRRPFVIAASLILLAAISLGLFWQTQRFAPGGSSQSPTSQQHLEAALTATAAARSLQATLAAQSSVQGPVGSDTGTLLYGNALTSPGGGWVNDGKQCAFTPAGYHVRVYSRFRTAWCFSSQQQFSNARITVQGQLLRGDIYGLIFRLNPNTPSFYALEVNSQGEYRFVRAQGNNPQNWLTLIDWTQSDAIQSGYGHLNTFTVLTKGSGFSFYINKVFVGSFTDKQYTSGFLALLVASEGSGQTEAVFDNIGVYQ